MIKVLGLPSSTNLVCTGSLTVSLLYVYTICEPSLRIVGVRTSSDVLVIVCASSTHAISTPSIDLIDCSLFHNPLNIKSEPVTLFVIVLSVTTKSVRLYCFIKSDSNWCDDSAIEF